MAAMVILQRKAAKALGAARYFTGKPCLRGHIGERNVLNGQCVSCLSAQSAAWYAANKQKVNDASLLWRAENPARARTANLQYNARRKEAHRNVIYSWRRSHPDKVRVYDANKRAMRRAAPGKHSPADIERLRTRQNDQCANCDVRFEGKYHVDHIVALSRGGSNWPSNLQLLCAACNMRKAAKSPDQWAKENGRSV
jgi:5-methylcytosine-specific restriction endonuclease McrA